jgi:hypothetical protein
VARMPKERLAAMAAADHARKQAETVEREAVRQRERATRWIVPSGRVLQGLSRDKVEHMIGFCCSYGWDTFTVEGERWTIAGVDSGYMTTGRSSTNTFPL